MTSLLSFTPSTPSIYLPTFSNVRHHHRLSSTTLLISYPHPLPRVHVLYRTPHAPPRPSLSASALRAAADGLLQDAGATAFVLAGQAPTASSSLLFDNLTQRNLLQQSLSRKLVHILSGLLFMLSWPIFSTSTAARYFASVVPLVNCLRLLLHGLSIVTNEGLVKSVTREGNPKELLRGPLYYVLILILCALAFWRESPVGVVSLAMMCGGDGVADIMGRKFGSIKIPYNQKKSWAGSISMFLFGFVISIGMLYYYSFLGYFQLNWVETVEKVALISLVATIVESLPITDVLDDNISVPLVSMAAAYLSFSL
ncbi:PREDICTED: phytol kinase [Prunus dulcis]|uniref:phytol kinase n=1 Tax=Prunus dulcis TaxID=3755 RepID=A0A5E4F1N4_PRUDU|nr:probable phytol kinase 1, chloroplastic [Prunus dulcis]XP_034205013.1 probable phytol kinase 1, chloroplastic [Prunus dulcis]VVA20561.1 PREDICTED: phytol kinase [Prunus dulcis]